MSEENGSQDPQDTGPQEESGEITFDRGSSLSLFLSDRVEDMLALAGAGAIALFVYVNY